MLKTTGLLGMAVALMATTACQTTLSDKAVKIGEDRYVEKVNRGGAFDNFYCQVTDGKGEVISFERAKGYPENTDCI